VWLSALDDWGYTYSTNSPTLLGVNNMTGIDFDVAVMFQPTAALSYFMTDLRDLGGITFTHIGVWNQLAPAQEPQPQPQPSPQPGGAVPEPATLALLSLAG